ncbi:DNA polymerase IV [Sporolactobacillus sp. THM7-7]|nr:DNA polymerase IV [Sporolactobacillus sp. THM7-7]
MSQARVIFHIDMNSFYASVEAASHPELKGKPLAIAGKPEERHGIVVTSSYEARKLGVRTTMTVQEARRLCPQLIVKHPDFALYRRTSDNLFEMLKGYTSLVEKASIDEGYMDVTGLIPRIHPVRLAEALQRRIRRELGLPCSIGIAPNKFLAKMASNIKKPMGLTILRKRDLPAKMWTLPIGEMHGVGPKTERRFLAIGIRTIGDLAKSDPGKMAERFGLPGRKLYDKANGFDDRPVDPGAWERYKSIGHSVTLPRDTRSMDEVRRTLDRLSDKLAGKIKRKHVASYELTVMIRYHDWQTVTRRLTTVQPMREKADIMGYALELFRTHWNGQAVRLLGLTLTSFHPVSSSSKQLDLFSYQHDAHRESMVRLMDKVNETFGEGALRPAGHLRDEKHE